jgi:5-methylcytosine-specific restriction endonuclease McrA
MPLEMFSEEHRLEILQQVELPHPPEKWIYLGVLSSGKPSCRIESRAWYEWHWARGIDPDKIRPSLSASSRRAVIRRDGYVCGICGGDVEPGDVDIDHIKPFSKGGSDHLDNLRVSHSSCNRRRGAREDD